MLRRLVGIRFLHRRNGGLRCKSTTTKTSSKLSSYPPREGSGSEPNHVTMSPSTHQYIYRRILYIINTFRTRGHYAASLDPLADRADTDAYSLRSRSFGSSHTEGFEHDIVRFLKKFRLHDGQKDGGKSIREFDLSAFPKLDTISGIEGLLDMRSFNLYNDVNIAKDPLDEDDLKNKNRLWSFNDIMEALSRTYCNTVGCDYWHIENEVQRKWLQDNIEGDMDVTRCRWNQTYSDVQRNTLEKLMRADHTAKFFNQKYPGSKVFGIDGCEVIIPALWNIAARASNIWGIEGIEMGMAHRGRMNVLHNFLQKPLASICNDFSEADLTYGDVKYHLGTRASITLDHAGYDGSKEMHISLSANPSHLEAVNPVVLGKCKAKQFYIGDKNYSKVMPILIHGDASFSGQGIVPETLELAAIADYNVGGTVHVVVNNQIGFTTDPREGRSAYHCTDTAKTIGAPIFHVNGDDVDAVMSVCDLAVDFRNKFKRDVVIDIVCYRRHGHNERDDPYITHPMMYKKIKKHPSVLEIYSKKCVDTGVITAQSCQDMSAKIMAEYESDFIDSKNYSPDPMDWLSGSWQGDAIGSLLANRPFNRTGVRPRLLEDIGKALTYVPEGFDIHPDVDKIMKERKKMLKEKRGFTWAFAEALAFGTLMTKFAPAQNMGKYKDLDQMVDLNSENDTNLHGISGIDALHSYESRSEEWDMTEHPTVFVRLSGQDCIRGTFNQRHAAIYDQTTNEPYWQLNNLEHGGFDEQATINVCNSSLSEFAVLGFEYGYSLSNEMSLTIFEAQFGDFVNNAQCIIDNFIAAGEEKWNNSSSLVMLLPHGYEGNGPEHSSGRLERFLTLVDDDCDSIPGRSAHSRAEIEAGFDALDSDGTGFISKSEFREAIKRFGFGDNVPNDRLASIRLDVLTTDLGVRNDGQYKDTITKRMWTEMMSAWLQKSAERASNIIVTVPSTPANYFHVLRRQIHRPYAKPMVVFTGKWLLHHKLCRSDMDDFTLGTNFNRIIVEGGRGDNTSHAMKIPLVPDDEIERVVLCTGKIFYHLFHAREAAKLNNVTFVRIEQLAPFPYDLLKKVMLRFPSAEMVWCQEEPKNMGAYTYIKLRMETLQREMVKDELGDNIFTNTGTTEPLMHVRKLHYIGRQASAAPASGGMKQHLVEQKEICEHALDLDRFKEKKSDSMLFGGTNSA